VVSGVGIYVATAADALQIDDGEIEMVHNFTLAQ